MSIERSQIPDEVAKGRMTAKQANDLLDQMDKKEGRMSEDPIVEANMRAREELGMVNPKPVSSSVQHPSHYNAGKFEVIDVIEDWKLGFSLGNAVKYIARADHKGKELEDLKKAAWYVLRRISERFPELKAEMEEAMERLR
jgi:hypothetical protein